MVQVRDIAKIVSDIASDYPIREVVLFGSYARGTATDSSDLDLMLFTDSTFSVFDAVNFKKAVELLVGANVDVVSGNHITNRTFERAVDRDKVLVYERDS